MIILIVLGGLLLLAVLLALLIGGIYTVYRFVRWIARLARGRFTEAEQAHINGRKTSEERYAEEAEK